VVGHGAAVGLAVLTAGLSELEGPFQPQRRHEGVTALGSRWPGHARGSCRAGRQDASTAPLGRLRRLNNAPREIRTPSLAPPCPRVKRHQLLPHVRVFKTARGTGEVCAPRPLRPRQRVGVEVPCLVAAEAAGRDRAPSLSILQVKTAAFVRLRPCHQA